MTDGQLAHVPVLLEETLAALNIRPEGVYVDATFGRGGHSRAILGRLGPQGRLLAMDRDPRAVAEGERIRDGRFSIVHAHFSRLRATVAAAGLNEVDGVLLDIGVSSPQIDEPERGFSFRFDAPLDMRMDTSQGQTAAEWLNTATEEEIAHVIREYGEERFAKSVARAIVAARAEAPIERTAQLARIAASAVRTRERGQDPATRTFQAVRIHINRELEELAQALPQGVEVLRAGGRLAVISFHSLEDRMVKRFMRAEAKGEELPPEIPMPAHAIKAGRLRLVGRAIRASETEVARNPRARSAVLRVAERTAEAACSG
ncbi:16S rRNA (cytosine1402-N4)-methyltransferase [Sulfuritortus calidifontis]|uniref:Ribosomal RNA small subunit methyltransferase H n=1 Tax=Sulfuritortus calidifontis TaxID=1914471 RepID=A0A4R3JVW0_9PROT|nr:16S rRNA (cytosine(1402)-N(4))-methyltransferase RsmH [Sulfuritortus calidifontis]TCS71043.1 16S rRNA (cytosine1402-N4)-methyltransferase [Sulfuritortus calidifontis]